MIKLNIYIKCFKFKIINIFYGSKYKYKLFNILLKNYKGKYKEKILFIYNFMQAILLLLFYYIYYLQL